jgi:excisionase family DNA binding protein
MPPAFLTLAEAAASLGVAASTLRHQAQSGRLRATLAGKTYIVTPAEVERYRREHLGRVGRPPTHGRPPGR